MKCTQCGCEELTLVNAPFTADYFKTSLNLKVYACNECGHLEFFENSWNETRKALKDKLQTLESKQRKISQEIDEKEKPKVEAGNKIQKLKEKLQDTEKELKKVLADKDITVRQQEEMSAELKDKMEAINNEIEGISHGKWADTSSLNKDLRKTNEEIEAVKKSLESPYLKFEWR